MGYDKRESSALTLAALCRQGLQYRLEVFKDPHKGWAVRSWDQIPALAYVASFHGQVLAAKSCPDMDEAYAFDLGSVPKLRELSAMCHQTVHPHVEHITATLQYMFVMYVSRYR